MKLKIKKLQNVESTNNEAIKLIRKNKLNPTIISARNQTNGRGTMGKKWISKKGNLFISIFFEISNKKIKFNDYSILNPHIIKNVLKKYSNNKILIKWPNDLLINKKKICGILQEVIEFKNKKYLIIGIGINTFISPVSKNFKSIALFKNSTNFVSNSQIFNDIKSAYEIFISDTSKYKISYFKKIYM
tara:strand:+ start:519 stop:1082 length:564 start_codon:yes stop_codon:yes gene_type:complete